MNNRVNLLAGTGDPYWYEWSVGLFYCLDLLYPDKNIESIVMQHSELQGLDDVVIKYNDGKVECVQVKHTRNNDTLTFSDMINGDKPKGSYLKQFSMDWKKASDEYKSCKAILFTNRNSGKQMYTVKVDNIASYERPALNKFWEYIKVKIDEAIKIEDIVVKNEWTDAWKEWLSQLEGLNDVEKLMFLKQFDIKASQKGLEELIDSIAEKISDYFQVDRIITTQLHQKLCYSLMEWTTTLRKKQEITKEDLMEALSLNSDNFKGIHDIPTKEPFFKSRLQFIDELEKKLIKREQPIIFLSGEPGTGKTNIVSQLTNKIDSVITLRFYAFKPLSPEDMYLSADKGVSDSRALWGDLLIQLRELLKGKLSKYQVPISNELLQTTERLREEVLRLSSVLYNETGNTTIICIDGIDHAARAGKRNTFLETLVPPEGVPENVCFFIVGQPMYEYPQYPYFLQQNDVLKVEVPKLTEDDIKQLYLDTVQQIPDEETDAAINIISKNSKRNTLSAVFAINEARRCKNIDELEECLTKKKISSGISSYYDYIWKSALNNLPSSFFHVDDTVAGVLSLVNKKINATILCDIYDDSTMSKNIWERILQKLYPIVIEEEDCFRVFHNDVRIYLENQLRRRMSSFAKIAEKIANYYISKSDDLRSKHELVFKLLQYANKADRYIDIFNKEYVTEAIKVKRPLDELIEQLEVTLKSITEVNEFKEIINLSCAVSTLNQFIKSNQWMNKAYIPDISIPDVLNCEKKVIHSALLTMNGMNNMFNEVEVLISNKEIERAKYILKKWIGNFTPEKIVEILNKNKQLKKGIKDNKIGEELKELLQKWGRICQYTGINYKLKVNCDKRNDRTKEIRAYFSKGWLIEGEKLTSAEEIKRTVNNLSIHFKVDFEEYIYTLMNTKHTDIIVKLTTNKNNKFSNKFIIKIVKWAIVNFKENVYKEVIDEIYKKRFKYIEISECELEQDCYERYEDMALILAFNGVNIKNIMEEFDKYLEKGTRRYQAVKCLLLAGFYLGKINRVIRNSEDIQTLNLDIYMDTIRFLFGSNNDIGRMEAETLKNEKFLLNYYIEIAQHLGDIFTEGLGKVMREVVQESNNLRHMDISWEYFVNNKEYSLLEEIFNDWMKKDGEVWRLEIDEMNDIAYNFIDRAKKLGWVEKAKEAERILEEKSIGYIGRKEYTLYYPLKWFENIEKDTELWKDVGVELLNISEIASQIGDNRAEVYIKAAIAEAAGRQGYESLWQFMNMNLVWDKEWIQAIFDGVIGSMEKNNFTIEELETIWRVSTNIFYVDSEARPYSSENNIRKIYITDIKEAILLVAERKGYRKIKESLAQIAKDEYELNRNEIEKNAYRIPVRWFELKESKHSYEAIRKMPCEAALEYVFEQYRRKDGDFEWEMVNEAIYKYENENIEEIEICADKVFEMLMQRSYKEYWEYDGVNKVYEVTFKYLDQEKVNLVYKKIIDNYFFKRDDNYRYDIYGIASDLENFAYCYYRKLKLADNISALKTILNMHIGWITGNKVLEMKNIYKIQDKECKIKNWSECAENIWREYINQV